MPETAQLGQVQFSFDLPKPYTWKKKDLPFLHPVGEAELHVSCRISWVNELKEPAGSPVFHTDSITVWTEGQAEVRSYRALFCLGHPLYAISRFEGNTVSVSFLENYSIWNHPNMLLWNIIHLENHLLRAQALILHSCYIEYRGEAILFTAPSGTGKTTQANIWTKVYGSLIINGDKSILQQTPSGWQACGFPMSGSSDDCQNLSFSIRAVVIVRQSLQNHIEELPLWKKVSLLYSECTVNPWNPQRMNYSMDLLTHLAQQLPVFILHCNMQDQAAYLLHHYLFKS